MRRIAFVVVLCLFGVGSASADEPKTAPQPEVLKLTAAEIFTFVEQTLEDPKANRVEAQEFLQRVLNGEVRMFETETTLGAATKCIARKCKNSACVLIDLKTMKGKCSNCCLAVQQ